ncbi:large conductance mechanosensitive channel protein MscL [Halobacillus amylolyticus]|uniref:Large-conductance mechanosensitive channel n=1 Tax=Halobacillus amylolyticus TaxID=2932259 RepID=A0ABY4H848_9BACI|nr:large conductance mechanosensitive channel protein MscL [Halobacillus amylolyticus]UOR10473.1 large conductance mechanosensitive channel protein MscL [Halobacillus amylolyticus]
MQLFQEFREFAVRGNAVDMGVGVVLGAAFGGFIDSFVSDILLPPIGVILTKMNFENLYISLSGGTFVSLAEAKAAGAATINYGLFITASIRFLLVLFAVFLVVRQINRWRKPHKSPMASLMKKECPFCCMPIPKPAVICPNCSSTLTEEGIEKPPRWHIK